MRSCNHDLPLEIMDRDPDLLERDSHNKNWTSLLIKKHACIHKIIELGYDKNIVIYQRFVNALFASAFDKGNGMIDWPLAINNYFPKWWLLYR